MTKILFVCLGNICRSPTAEGVFRARAANAGLRVEVDSAGTGSWHVGEAPDRRAQIEAAKRGYDLSNQHARQVIQSDFLSYDYIVAMDHGNLRSLASIEPKESTAKTVLFLSYSPECGCDEVPDPYYEGGFDYALDLIEGAADGLIAALMRGR
ncbi:MAG: low molecular weight protein-tyrosine-phosphatase [Pikeienuella sp.]